ncbi:MAG: 3-oxoacyl-ACP synthase [Bacteroidota bacterium]
MQKQQLIQACRDYFENKIISLNTIIREVTESSNAESKSSAGDKHETSKAMMQLEIEKLGNQLKEAEEQLKEFEKINFNKVFQTIEQGSLVETDKGYFFIAGSAGKLIIEEETVFVISDRSPLSLAFKNKKTTEQVMFNNTQYLIKGIQ